MMKPILFAMILILFNVTRLLANETAKPPPGYVWIPPGTFQMGSDDGDIFSRDEKPLHSVTLTKGFFLSDHEVTVGEYREFVEKSGHEPPILWGTKFRYVKSDLCNWNRSDTERHPVNCVSWFDAAAYIRWLNKRQEKWSYRLPTEAEWEYAARAGKMTKWPCGEAKQCVYEIAWFNENSKKTTNPVKSKKPNSWGLYDMYGNVWEWCRDGYRRRYPRGPVTDPTGPTLAGGKMVVRGGAYDLDMSHLRPTFRMFDKLRNRSDNIGFRLVAIPKK